MKYTTEVNTHQCTKTRPSTGHIITPNKNINYPWRGSYFNQRAKFYINLHISNNN